VHGDRNDDALCPCRPRPVTLASVSSLGAGNVVGDSVGAKVRPRLSLAEWEAGGGSTTHRGHRIFTRSEIGSGRDALVLIHGFPTASWDWEALWPELAKRFDVYTLDMIGFGFSAKPTDYAYSILDQADIFEAFLRDRGVAAYHVLAHDYGDTVAQELLARQGEPGERPELRSVAFLNGGLFPETHRPVLIQRLLLSPLGPFIARQTSRARMAQNMRGIFGPATQPDEQLLDAFWSLLTRENGVAVMPKLIRYMVERRQQRARWVGALERARIPLKLIDGAADPISGRHMAARYEELVPRADVTLLDGIGHYPQVEAPSEVLTHYLAFRDRVASASDDETCRLNGKRAV
jgi:pimeloyl-ACP methyl ester carboxylesterase